MHHQSSIVLLAASTIAKKGPDSNPAYVVILPVLVSSHTSCLWAYMRIQMLFMAGMILLDPVDSILMLYTYTGFPDKRLHLFGPLSDTYPRRKNMGLTRKPRRHGSPSVAQRSVAATMGQRYE
jgi:hypothetical protein